MQETPQGNKHRAKLRCSKTTVQQLQENAPHKAGPARLASPEICRRCNSRAPKPEGLPKHRPAGAGAGSGGAGRRRLRVTAYRTDRGLPTGSVCVREPLPQIPAGALLFCTAQTPNRVPAYSFVIHVKIQPHLNIQLLGIGICDSCTRGINTCDKMASVIPKFKPFLLKMCW